MFISIVCDEIRSTYNIGSILRTADGFGATEVIACGLTPYIGDDERPPHVRQRHKKEIAKTALGAEVHIPMRHFDTTIDAILSLKANGFYVLALEQSPKSQALDQFRTSHEKIALVLGTETSGLSNDILTNCDQILEIPMHGKKESFNVSVACGIALYELRKN